MPIEDFQLAAMVRHHGETSLKSVPLHQEVQNALSEDWAEQYDKLVHEKELVQYTPQYVIESDGEVFVIDDFRLPAWLTEHDRPSVHLLPPIAGDVDTLDSTKALIAFSRIDGEEIILFQRFTPSKVIAPRRYLFLEGGLYATRQSSGLVLGNQLTAVFYRSRCQLLFDDFRTTNAFLSLADYFAEATEAEIREILRHPSLIVEDEDVFASKPTQWFAKRFALLRASGVLDSFTSIEIANRAKAYGLQVETRDDRLVFPTDRSEAKKLLMFLNEELFKGAITEALYQTNSKRLASS